MDVREKEGSQERKERRAVQGWVHKALVAPQDPQVLLETAGPEARVLQAGLEFRALRDVLEPPAALDPLDPRVTVTRTHV